ncbi:MAG: type II toxin-antitoxin system RelE/ParE family toxin [Lutispora sp.]|nr:type II toxin-antitoxin system RelE/ParE family toxin [Lutispora sp.]
MKYEIRYESRSIKYLKRLDKDTQLRILKAINGLPSGDVKKLQGSLEDYRLRVGSYRILFSKDDNVLTINILDIAPRGGAYKK